VSEWQAWAREALKTPDAPLVVINDERHAAFSKAIAQQPVIKQSATIAADLLSPLGRVFLGIQGALPGADWSSATTMLSGGEAAYAGVVAAAAEVCSEEVWAAYTSKRAEVAGAGGKDAGIDGAPPAARNDVSSPLSRPPTQPLPSSCPERGHPVPGL